MAVNPEWLHRTRLKNQQDLGLGGSTGMNGMGATADLFSALRSRQAAVSAAAPAPARQSDTLALPPPSKITNYLFFGAAAVAGISIIAALVRRFRGR